VSGWGAPQAANGVLMEDGNILALYNALNQPMLIELHVDVGHDEHTLTSNSVLLLCPPIDVPAAEPASSPKSSITP
jgi:hypothetical protein